MNDKSLLVVMHATCSDRMMPTYLEQLEKAGIETHIVWLPDYPTGGGTMALKIEFMRQVAMQFHDYERLIFTCAHDMLFFGHKQDVLDKMPMDRIMLAAEKNCYPHASIAHKFTGTTPWKFVNSGPYSGTPQLFLEWTDSLKRDPAYDSQILDQGLLNIMVAEGRANFGMDDRTELFYCLYGGYDELDFENGHPVNRLTGTHPPFAHANGHWPTDELWEKYRRSLA